MFKITLLISTDSQWFILLCQNRIIGLIICLYFCLPIFFSNLICFFGLILFLLILISYCLYCICLKLHVTVFVKQFNILFVSCIVKSTEISIVKYSLCCWVKDNYTVFVLFNLTVQMKILCSNMVRLRCSTLCFVWYEWLDFANLYLITLVYRLLSVTVFYLCNYSFWFV